jgi:hypothetical protein
MILPNIAFIDDSFAVRQLWKLKIKDATFIDFETPEMFFAKVQTEKAFLDQIECVITDFYFDGLSGFTGLTFAQKLRPQFQKSIILATSAMDFDENLPDCFDLLIDKDPVSWKELSSKMNKGTRMGISNLSSNFSN